jgi:Domain of unknown function (DUF1833)
MPDTTLSQAIREAYASAPNTDVAYHTLEIYHPSFTTPIRVVRDFVDLSAKLESTAPRDASTYVTFVGYAFDIVPPEVSTTGVPQCQITIDNVSRDIMANLESAVTTSTPITVIYRMFLSSDLTGPQNNPPMALTIISISADVFKITATATFGDLVNKRFPSQNYTIETFPGLVP